MGLRELRLKRGMTQRELADKVGISYGRVGDYEKGRYSIRGMSLDLRLDSATLCVCLIRVSCRTTRGLHGIRHLTPKNNDSIIASSHHAS